MFGIKNSDIRKTQQAQAILITFTLHYKFKHTSNGKC